MRMNLFRNLAEAISLKLPLDVYCKLTNIRNRIRKKKQHLTPFRAPSIYKVEDGTDHIYICRRRRHNRYKRGVIAGVTELAKTYHLPLIPIQPSGVIIDCGANVGELGLWARQNGMDYIAFEPENLEADCVDLNAFDGAAQTHRKALWHSDTMLTFYSKPDTADSSVIDMGDSVVTTSIDAVALDGAVDLSTYSGTIILKVEAEGAEPEVLAGAKETLLKAHYVVIDCGYERGVEKRHTFIESHSILSAAGFDLKAAFLREGRMLYAKKGLPCGQAS
jgi:FkbM family methyltransferase